MITRAEILAIKALATKQGREEQGAFIAEGEKCIGDQDGDTYADVFAEHISAFCENVFDPVRDALIDKEEISADEE